MTAEEEDKLESYALGDDVREFETEFLKVSMFDDWSEFEDESIA